MLVKLVLVGLVLVELVLVEPVLVGPVIVEVVNGCTLESTIDVTELAVVGFEDRAPVCPASLTVAF